MMLDADGLRSRLIAAVPVPFDREGRIHAGAQASQVRAMAASPAGGVAVWAHTGRGLMLTIDQRAEVLTAWKSGLAPGQLVVAAAGSPPRERNPEVVMANSLAMARQAAELGADAILVHPPVAFRGLPTQDRLILEYHARVAEAGLPLILFYLYEAAGGISYGPTTLLQLLARPEVLGIKLATLDSVMTYQQVGALIRERAPEKLLITGEDRFLGYSLMCGAQAALIGMGAACVDLQHRMMRAYLDGAAAEFLELSRKVDDLAQNTFIAPMEGYIQRMLICLVHEGVIPSEAAHDPWGPKLPAGESDRIAACLTRIGRP
ncbi:dihydrodipicolinate synthase family protein [Isosphaeraceae bacterium EP7]